MIAEPLMGCYTALATPVRRNGEVNYQALETEVLYSLKNGCNGVLALGCTGADSLFDVAERLDIIAHAAASAEGIERNRREAVIAGIGESGTRETIESGKRVIDTTGVRYLMVISPPKVKPTQDGMRRHYVEIADALAWVDPKVGLILYSVPSRTGGEGIMPDTAIFLAEHDNIVNLKEASGTRYTGPNGAERYLSDMRRLHHETADQHFSLLSGDDDRTFMLMKEAGAKGVISVASNVDPGRTSRMVELCLSGDYDEAERLNSELAGLYSALFMEPNPVPLHYALGRIGIPAGTPRSPLTAAARKTRRRISKILAGLDLPYRDGV